MPDLWSDLLACLDLHPVPSAGTGDERAGDDVTEFEGRNQQLEYHRVFGGQLLGQFIRIAAMTCPDKAVKSRLSAEKQVLLSGEYKLPKTSLWLTPTRGQCQSYETNSSHLSYAT